MLAGQVIINALENYGVLEQFCIGMFYPSKKEFSESNRSIEEVVKEGKRIILKEATFPNILDNGNIHILLRDSFRRRQGTKFCKIIYDDIPPLLVQAALLWRAKFFKNFLQFLVEENVRYSFEEILFETTGATFEDLATKGRFSGLSPTRWISGTLRYYATGNSAETWKKLDTKWRDYIQKLDEAYSDEIHKS